MLGKKLYITVGQGPDTGPNAGGGCIWSGKPDPTSTVPQLYREFTSTDTWTEGGGTVWEDMYAIAGNNDYNSSTFIVCVTGDGGNIYTSERVGNEPSTWTKTYSTPVPAVGRLGLKGIAYGGGSWVAVGAQNTVVRSTDGYNWTKLEGAIPGGDHQWICYGAGRFVVVGGQYIDDPDSPGDQITVGTIMYSDDGGLTWFKGSSGTDDFLYSIAYSPELNVFAAVGSGGAIVSVKGPE